MDKSRFVLMIAFALLFALLLVISLESGFAQPDNGYSLDWWTVDGGGGVLKGSGYSLEGTVGQPEAGNPLEGNTYILQSGFWPVSEKLIYLPIVVLK